MEKWAQMNLSGAIKIIKEFEGLRLKAYLCPVGKPTIGWGHTLGVALGQEINEAQAEEFLQQDLQRVAVEPLRNLFDGGILGLTENELNALVSFIFNVKLESFKTSTMLKIMNNPEGWDEKAIANEFPKWNKGRVNGVLTVLPGLTRRRAMERELFLS